MVNLIKEESDNKIRIDGVKCKYIINSGSGQYGKGIVTVVFEKGSDAWYWITGTNVGSLRSFKEGETYDITAIKYSRPRYLSNVKVAPSKGE